MDTTQTEWTLTIKMDIGHNNNCGASDMYQPIIISAYFHLTNENATQVVRTKWVNMCEMLWEKFVTDE